MKLIDKIKKYFAKETKEEVTPDKDYMVSYNSSESVKFYNSEECKQMTENKNIQKAFETGNTDEIDVKYSLDNPSTIKRIEREQKEEEFTPEEKEKIDKDFEGLQKALSITSLIRADIPEEIKQQEIAKVFRNGYMDTIKNKMALWMRLNYLCNTISTLQAKNVPIDWKMVREIILIPQGQYGFDLEIVNQNIDTIESLSPIIELRDYVCEAQVLGDFYTWKRRKCRICGETFFMTYSEVEWYRNKDYSMPRTCKSCRKGIKAERAAYHDIIPEENKEDKYTTSMEAAMQKAGII